MPPETGSGRDKLRPARSWSDALQLKEVRKMRDSLIEDLVDIDENLAMSRDDFAWVDLAREKIRVIISSYKEK